MEKARNVWIENQTQKKWAGNRGEIIADLSTFLRGTLGPRVADPKVWFEKFKRRFGLHHVKLVREAASADHDAAKNYPPQAHGTNRGEGIYAGAGF